MVSYFLVCGFLADKWTSLQNDFAASSSGVMSPPEEVPPQRVGCSASAGCLFLNGDSILTGTGGLLFSDADGAWERLSQRNVPMCVAKCENA
jgi:hypothetical protein